MTVDRLENASAKTVSNVRSVRRSSTTFAKIARGRDAARVVDASSLVNLLRASSLEVSENLLETVTRGSARGTVLDHAEDLVVGARVGVGAVVGTGVILHQTRVGDRDRSGRDADASLALLHDSGEDEARVDTRRLGHVLNRGLDLVDLFVGVVLGVELGAGASEGLEVDVPEGVEADPGVVGRPSGAGRAVTLEELAGCAGDLVAAATGGRRRSRAVVAAGGRVGGSIAASGRGVTASRGSGTVTGTAEVGASAAEAELRAARTGSAVGAGLTFTEAGDQVG